MTTKKNLVKTMFMSTVAAVVFSFVFTTSANANSKGETPQQNNLEIRVKDAPNFIENLIEQTLEIRVRVRV